MTSKMAQVKNDTSRIKLNFLALNGLIAHMDPATTLTIKEAAPISSPRASEPKFECMALNVENKSGLPFPKAKNVTPVYQMQIWKVSC